MNEVQQIIDLVQRAYTGDAWHGPSLGELLEDIDPETAMVHLLPTVHSILELVRHIAVWQEAVVHRINGEEYEVPDAEDWQTELDEDSWSDALFRLEAGRRALEEKLSTLQDSDLWATTPGKPYNNYVMIHGLIQHTLYHAGQIALLKRLYNM